MNHITEINGKDLRLVEIDWPHICTWTPFREDEDIPNKEAPCMLGIRNPHGNSGPKSHYLIGFAFKGSGEIFPHFIKVQKNGDMYKVERATDSVWANLDQMKEGEK